MLTGKQIIQPPELLLLGNRKKRPDWEVFRQGWLDCLTNDPVGSIYLHPESALSADVNGRSVPVVYTCWAGERGEPEALASVAVLVAKKLGVRFLPGVPWKRRLRTLRVVGNQLLGDNDIDAATTFLDTLVQFLRSGRTSYIYFEDIDVASPMWQALENVAARGGAALFHPERRQPHWWIRFPENPEDYWQRFNAKSLRNIRREGRRFEHTVHCMTKAEDASSFLEQAHQVAVRHWQAKRGVLHIRNDDGERRLLEFFASLGALRCYLMEHGGQPVAFMLGFQWKGHFVPEEMGYDLTYAKYSPGTVLTLRIVEDLIARDTPQYVDFGYGHAEYKRLFCNWQTESGPVLLVRKSLLPILNMWLDNLSGQVSQSLRAVVKKSGLSTALRKIYRK
jgi:hypothetical protein